MKVEVLWTVHDIQTWYNNQDSNRYFRFVIRWIWTDNFLKINWEYNSFYQVYFLKTSFYKANNLINELNIWDIVLVTWNLLVDYDWEKPKWQQIRSTIFGDNIQHVKFSELYNSVKVKQEKETEPNMKVVEENRNKTYEQWSVWAMIQNVSKKYEQNNEEDNYNIWRDEELDDILWDWDSEKKDFNENLWKQIQQNEIQDEDDEMSQYKKENNEIMNLYNNIDFDWPGENFKN